MSGIKRFNHGVCEYPGGIFSEMNKETDGDYVLYSDHEAEVARLRAEVEKVRGYEVAPLEAKVAELRADMDNAAAAAVANMSLACEKEREADVLRLDAERWRHARMLFTIDDIEGRSEDLRSFSYFASEEENIRADEAIDRAIAAMGADA